MRAILINAKDRTINEILTDGSLSDLYRLIDCRCVTVFELDNGDVVWCDDEGLLNNPQDFFTIEEYPQPIAGNALILGSKDGENASAVSDLDSVKKDVIFMDLASVIHHQRLFG